MQKKIHVLLVDDEPDFMEPMAFWLRGKGYLVSVAPNGDKAIQIVKEQAPHIAFLDIKMPGMDGIETLRRIRQINQKLPVIMITAYADEEKLVKSQELNISGFFAKDGDVRLLQNTIELTLRTYKKIWRNPKK
jgi:CheY-like chemotaxis protein